MASCVPSAVIAAGSDSKVSSRAAALIAASWFKSLVVRSLASTRRLRSVWMATDTMAAKQPMRKSRRGVVPARCGLASDTARSAARAITTTATDSQRLP